MKKTITIISLIFVFVTGINASSTEQKGINNFMLQTNPTVFVAIFTPPQQIVRVTIILEKHIGINSWITEDVIETSSLGGALYMQSYKPLIHGQIYRIRVIVEVYHSGMFIYSTQQTSQPNLYTGGIGLKFTIIIDQ